MKRRYLYFDSGAKGSGGGAADNEDKDLTPEQIVEKINEKQKNLEESVSKKADQSEIESLKKEIEELKKAEQDARFKDLNDKLQAQGEEITTLREGGIQASRAKATSIKEALELAFNAKQDGGQSIAELMKDIHAKGGKHPAPIMLKVAIDMGEINTIGSGTTQVTLTENTGIISRIRKRELRYLANVTVGGIGNERALWIEETDEQGTPIFIGEGDPKTQLSVKYVEKTKQVKKIAVYGKVTTELMADLPQLIAYIQGNLMRRLDIAMEDQLFSGDDTGDNLAGLEEFATAFSAGDLAASIESANEFDVLEAVANQVKLAHGEANGIFINPTTMSKMKLIKDSTGRPVWKDYVTIDGSMRVSGMNIIETVAVTTGTFIGGDLSVVNVRFREEMGIQIGLDGNDFINNKKTMLAEKRLVQFVSANDTPVLVQGVFADAIEDLNLPPAEEV